MKRFLLFSLYLVGGAGALFCAFFLIGISNLNKLMSPSDEEFSIIQIKNNLKTGVKECLVREIENESTTFKEVSSFSENYPSSKFFVIKPIDSDTCFRVKAFPKINKKHTWFKIERSEETGEFSMTCGDSSKPGCDIGNTW